MINILKMFFNGKKSQFGKYESYFYQREKEMSQWAINKSKTKVTLSSKEKFGHHTWEGQIY